MGLFSRPEGMTPAAVEPELPFPATPAPAPQPAPSQPAATPSATAPASAAPPAAPQSTSPPVAAATAAAASTPPAPPAVKRVKRRSLVSRLPWKIRLGVYAATASACAAGLWLAAMIVHYTTEFPDPLSVRSKERAPVIRVLARDGSVIADRGAAHDFVPIDMLPQHVIDAVVATEDRRFFRHWGIDPAGLVRAAFANLRAGRFVQGGSTLTQQLAKNLFLSSERTMSRKLDEFSLALWLEVRLTKREIIELYLNRVYFGGGAYGIEAAAQRYFDKSAGALTLAEAALIAGLLKAPSKYSPTSSPKAARTRGHAVLAKMRDAGAITEKQHAQALGETVRFVDFKGQRTTNGFEYAIDLVLEKLPPLLSEGNGELIVETTIDAALQRRANELVTASLSTRGKAMGASQAALVAIDTDGGVRALVGGRSYAESQFNRVTKARRQPGSVFKPFVYLTALEKGLTPDTITYDLPLTIDGWAPRNDNGEYVGALTLRQAIAQSVNTVAVRLNMDVGIPAVAATARRLGVASELRHDPSMALGTSELTLMELAGAYGVLASGGITNEPHVIRRVRLANGRVLYARPAPMQTRVVALDDVGAMNDMLNAALVAGTGRRAALPRHPAAGKTGTTQDFRDAWFVGYTAHMTAGVWLGNDDSSPMKRVMGGNLPAEMWHDLMLDAHKSREPLPLPGTSSAAQVAGASHAPLVRTARPELLPWRAGRQTGTSSPVMRAHDEPARPEAQQELQQPAAKLTGRVQPSRSLAAVRAARERSGTPSQQQAPASVVAGSSGRTVGQRLVIEPPVVGGAAERRPADVKAAAAAHAQERISDDFLAKVLAPQGRTPPPSPTLARRDVPQRGLAFDPADIQRRIEAAPAETARAEPAERTVRPPTTAPTGMMSLGLGLAR